MAGNFVVEIEKVYFFSNLSEILRQHSNCYSYLHNHNWHDVVPLTI